MNTSLILLSRSMTGVHVVNLRKHGNNPHWKASQSEPKSQKDKQPETNINKKFTGVFGGSGGYQWKKAMLEGVSVWLDLIGYDSSQPMQWHCSLPQCWAASITCCIKEDQRCEATSSGWRRVDTGSLTKLESQKKMAKNLPRNPASTQKTMMKTMTIMTTTMTMTMNMAVTTTTNAKLLRLTNSKFLGPKDYLRLEARGKPISEALHHRWNLVCQGDLFARSDLSSFCTVSLAYRPSCLKLNIWST